MSDAGTANLSRDLETAHRALLRQDGLQFYFTRLKTPLPPQWLVKLLQILGRIIGPVAPYLFWSVVALAVVAILVFIVREVFHRKHAPVRWRAHLGQESGEWRPAPDQARALLAEADALAGQGQYEEAAHLILLRSIQDIGSRRPNSLRPSLTSRDIALLPGLPPSARATFTGIAQTVEQSLFGGRRLDQGAFIRCRTAYEAFAIPSVWS